MNAIVIYKSSTGFTKKYAKWVAEALECEAVPADKAAIEPLINYIGGSFNV